MPRSTPQQTLFLVRHGQTRLAGRYCGTTNPSLSPKGRAEAAAAAKVLARQSIDLCYTSPQLRARQTAAILNRNRPIPLIPATALKELNFGAWERLRFEDIAKRWPKHAARWAQDPTRVRIPHGETFAALRRRIRSFLQALKRRSERNLLVVAHGGSLSALILEWLGKPDRDFPKYIAPTGSVRRLRSDTLKDVAAAC